MTGRIVRIISNLYTVEAVNNGRILSCNCRARGKFRNDGLTPLVGDIVDFNEYIDFDLSKIQNLTPENFCPFENSINNVGEYNLTKDEVRYIISLFSAMYTFNHDSLEKAYTYNHKWSEEYREFLNNLEK